MTTEHDLELNKHLQNHQQNEQMKAVLLQKMEAIGIQIYMSKVEMEDSNEELIRKAKFSANAATCWAVAGGMLPERVLKKTL